MEINKIIIEKQDEEYIGQVYGDSIEPLRNFYPNENQIRRFIGSLKYLKINTLWKREGKDKKGIIRPGDYSKQEFNNIKLYQLTEKVHGENTRVIWDMGDVTFEGRNDNSSINTHTVKILQKKFTKEFFNKHFPEAKLVILFLEAYGGGINKVGNGYRDDYGIIMFGIMIDGFWLEYDNISDIGKKTDIPVVPDLGICNIGQAEHIVKNKPQSLITDNPYIMEGIVATSYPMMMFRDDGDPIMFKLKVKDYARYDLFKDN